MAARLTAGVLVVLAVPLCLTSAFGQPSQAPPSREPPQASLAVVSGRVFDGDGQSPARFAQVQLWSRALTGGAEGIHYSAMASEDGVFTLSGVRPGTYYMAATKATYPMAFYSPDGSHVAEPGAAIPIAAGQQLRDLVLRVRKGGVIAGRITDEGGDPVRVPVAVRPVTAPAQGQNAPPLFSDLPAYLLTTITSDDQGNYRIYGLAPGDYFVMTGNELVPNGVLHDGRSRTFARAFFPDTTDPMAAVPVSVAMGQERGGIDLTARAVPLVKVSGAVVAPPDLVELVSLRLTMIGPPAILVQARSALASSGRFVLDGVPPGRYWLVAHSRQAPPPDADAATPSLLWWAMLPVNIADNDVPDVGLALQPAISLSGRVVVDQPEAGQPIDVGRCTVQLVTSPGSRQNFEWPMPARTSADGRFLIVNVTPGRYRLAVSASAGSAPRVVSVTLNGQEAANGEIEVSGANVEGMVVRIRRAPQGQ